jgi:hypothetical protein
MLDILRRKLGRWCEVKTTTLAWRDFRSQRDDNKRLHMHSSNSLVHGSTCWQRVLRELR